MAWPATDSPPAGASGLAASAPAARTTTSAPPCGPPLRGWLIVVLAAIYLATVGLSIRLIANVEGGADLAWYLSLLVAFFALHTLVWRAVLVALIPASLMATRDPLLGLGLGLTTMAYAVVISGIAVASQEME